MSGKRWKWILRLTSVGGFVCGEAGPSLSTFTTATIVRRGTPLPPPRAEDPLFVATDERDPDSLRKIADEGAVFVSDLLTMDDRQAFGWPRMITDVMALVEHQIARPQQLLLRTLFELLRGRDRELPVQAAMQTVHASGLNVGVFGIKSSRSSLSAAGWSEARRLEHGRSLTLPCDVHSTPIRTHSGSESTSCDT